MRHPVAVFSQCQQLLGKQFQDGRSLPVQEEEKKRKKVR